MRGKELCNILREIRRKVAEENGIPYQPRECNHVEECLGTCPYCEQEADYLLKELEMKEAQGDVVKTIDKKTLMQTVDRAYVENRQEEERERLLLEKEERMIRGCVGHTFGYVSCEDDDDGWRQRREEARKQMQKDLEEMQKRQERGTFRKWMKKLFNRKSEESDQ